MKCIHCGREMMCNQGVAHHECSRRAQTALEGRDKLLNDAVYLLETMVESIKVGVAATALGEDKR